MKQVIIVVPEGKANLSSITGSFEILTRANEYWQKRGNQPVMEIRIAGFVKELKLNMGFFSVYPIHIEEIKKTDLLIIPSVSYDYEEVIQENNELITWIRKQYKRGTEIASICTGTFLLAATASWKERPVPRTGMRRLISGGCFRTSIFNLIN